MSRIHEALKRAEQERAAAQGGQAPGFAPAVAPEAPPVIPESGEHAVARPGSPSTFSAAASSFSGAFSLDSLLGRTPKVDWQPDQKAMLFFNGNESGRGTEEFRTLRSRLYHLRENMTLKKVLVTSALPKEGKSFTSANLAQVLVRQHGRRVLLIDADLRAPRLHLMLGTAPAPGLAEYLQGTSDEFSIMQRGSMENLFFIPSGDQISDAAEMVANGKLKILLQRVEPLFDWIIIDSPPAVPVSDAGVLAKACDGVVMVVRSNATPIDMARRAREEFPDQALVGVVLNGTNTETTPYSRYYYDAYVKQASPESKS